MFRTTGYPPFTPIDVSNYHHSWKIDELKRYYPDLTIEEINSLSRDFTVGSIKVAIDYLEKFGSHSRIFSTDFHIDNSRRFGDSPSYNPYTDGLKIFDEKESRIEDDLLDGESRNIEHEFFRDLLDAEKLISDEERSIIQNQAAPFLHMSNIFYHQTPGSRIPLMAKVGIWPRALADRFLQRKYKGAPWMASGWGEPYIGQEFVDVWLDYPNEKDPNFDPEDFGHNFLKENPGTCSRPRPGHKIYQEKKWDPVLSYHHNLTSEFIIDIKPENWKKVVYWFSSSPQGSGGYYIKGRILPEELVGLVMKDPAILDLCELMYHRNSGHKYTRQELLEIIGANTRKPIYNQSGDLVWPEFIEERELYSSKVNEYPIDQEETA